MSYYVFLAVSLIVVIALCWAIWKRTASIAFPFGMAMLYFWTLHGAWSIVTDLQGGDSKKQYHYLYEKVFPIYLDEYYAWTLAIYAGFLVIVAFTVLFSVRPARLPTDDLKPILLSHDKVIGLCAIAGFMSFMIVHEALGGAIQTGASGYAVTRAPIEMGWFRIHQILNRVAIVPAAIGLATLMAGGQCRFLSGYTHTRHYLGYTVVLGSMFCFCVALGNKNELSLALFSGCLFYLVNSTRPKTMRLATAGVVMLALVGFIDYARGFSLVDISSNISLGEIAYSLVRLADSNEGFAAHMSLYGAMAYEIPLTYGSSIYSFLTSAVPRVLWPDRPYDIYWYYASGVAAVEGQGYSIHHATGWYLNFGIPGVVMGAALLGRVWAALYNNLVHRAYLPAATWWRIFCIIGFFTFTANLPSLVRAGPEAYKGILIDSFFIPVAVLALARSTSQQILPRQITARASRLDATTPSAPTTRIRRQSRQTLHSQG